MGNITEKEEIVSTLNLQKFQQIGSNKKIPCFRAMTARENREEKGFGLLWNGPDLLWKGLGLLGNSLDGL